MSLFGLTDSHSVFYGLPNTFNTLFLYLEKYTLFCTKNGTHEKRPKMVHLSYLKCYYFKSKKLCISP